MKRKNGALFIVLFYIFVFVVTVLVIKRFEYLRMLGF